MGLEKPDYDNLPAFERFSLVSIIQGCSRIWVGLSLFLGSFSRMPFSKVNALLEISSLKTGLHLTTYLCSSVIFDALNGTAPYSIA